MNNNGRRGPPEAKNPNSIRLIGVLVLAALVLAIILLALGVFDFEQRGWFN